MHSSIAGRLYHRFQGRDRSAGLHVSITAIVVSSPAPGLVRVVFQTFPQRASILNSKNSFPQTQNMPKLNAECFQRHPSLRICSEHFRRTSVPFWKQIMCAHDRLLIKQICAKDLRIRFMRMVCANGFTSLITEIFQRRDSFLIGGDRVQLQNSFAKSTRTEIVSAERASAWKHGASCLPSNRTQRRSFSKVFQDLFE